MMASDLHELLLLISVKILAHTICVIWNVLKNAFIIFTIVVIVGRFPHKLRKTLRDVIASNKFEKKIRLHCVSCNQ